MDALLNVRVNHLNNRRVPVIIIDDPQMETIYTSEGKFTAAGAHFFHLLLELHSRSLASVFILSCKEDILWPIIEQCLLMDFFCCRATTGVLFRLILCLLLRPPWCCDFLW